MKSVFLDFCIFGVLAFSSATEDVLPESCPAIISKNEWGARKAKQVQYSVTPVDYVIIHHTVTRTCQNKLECASLLKSIQSFHLDDMHFDDIAYNFMIGDDGNVYEGRGWHKVGSHTRGYNSKSICIAFLGTFADKLPTEQQLKAAKDLIQCALGLEEIKEDYKLYGARQLSKTESPGLTLLNELQTWPHFAQVA